MAVFPLPVRNLLSLPLSATLIVHQRVEIVAIWQKHRPTSHLSYLSKLLERVVTARYNAHAEEHKLFPARQSAFHQDRRFERPQ